MDINKDSGNYCVYKHTSPSNKVYIGITCRSKPELRWGNGRGYYYNIHFSNAIKTYGWENFRHEVLIDNLSKEKAELYEVILIRQYNSTNSEKGYNISNGGSSYGKHTEETKNKISIANSGINNGMSFATGSLNPASKKVCCLNTKEIFDTIKEAQEKYKCSNVSNVCIGKRKSSGILNGKKLTWAFYEDYVSMSEETIVEKINKANIREKRKSTNVKKKKDFIFDKPITCLNTKRTFYSMGEVLNFYPNIRKDRLFNSCDTQSSHGTNVNGDNLYWMYNDEYEKLTDADITNIIYKTYVYCETTNKIFNSTESACKYYNIKSNHIDSVYKGKRNYCGEYNGEKLKWKRYLDVIKENATYN